MKYRIDTEIECGKLTCSCSDGNTCIFLRRYVYDSSLAYGSYIVCLLFPNEEIRYKGTKPLRTPGCLKNAKPIR